MNPASLKNGFRLFYFFQRDIYSKTDYSPLVRAKFAHAFNSSLKECPYFSWLIYCSPHELIFNLVCCRPAWVGMFSTTWGSSTLSSLKLARRTKQIEDILLSLRTSTITAGHYLRILFAVASFM
jgi:hypothetical protein